MGTYAKKSTYIGRTRARCVRAGNTEGKEEDARIDYDTRTRSENKKYEITHILISSLRARRD